MRYVRAVSVFLVSSALLASCSHPEKRAEPRASKISAADEAEFASLVSHARVASEVCENWLSSVNLIQEEISSQKPDQKIRPETYAALLEGLKNYPGVSKEQVKLAKFFREAGTRPGFPPDYDWDWSGILNEPLGCAEIHWFSLAKTAATQCKPRDCSRIRTLLLQQMNGMMKNEPRLVTLLVALAVIREMAESKLIRLSTSDTRRLDWVDTEARKLKTESVERNKTLEADDQFWACTSQMGRGEKIETQGKCDREKVVELSKTAGQLMSEELNRTSTLAEALSGWLRARSSSI